MYRTYPTYSTYPTAIVSRVRSMPALITEWGDQELWPAIAADVTRGSLMAVKPQRLVGT